MAELMRQGYPPLSNRPHLYDSNLASVPVNGYALPQLRAKSMKRTLTAICCAAMCLLAEDASAAVKYKRFVHCADGLVAERTCECHKEGSRHFHYCHAGQYCHAFDGSCHQ